MSWMGGCYKEDYDRWCHNIKYELLDFIGKYQIDYQKGNDKSLNKNANVIW